VSVHSIEHYTCSIELLDEPHKVLDSIHSISFSFHITIIILVELKSTATDTVRKIDIIGGN
jgi:hypothetical protein